MTDGEYRPFRFEHAAPFPFECKRSQLSAAHAYIRNLGVEVKFTAHGDYLQPYARHHDGKKVGAYMRFIFVFQLLAAAVFCKLGNHRGSRAAAYPRVQFSVRKSARAAFAELHVALFVQFSAGKKAFHLCRALFHVRPALDDYRFCAQICQRKRGEQSRGTASHHGYLLSRKSAFRRAYTRKIIFKRIDGRFCYPYFCIAARPNNTVFIAAHLCAQTVNMV